MLKNTYVKILLILSLTYTGALIVNYAINKGLKKYRIHEHSRLEELLRKATNYDILYVGSSRTHLTINPRYVDSITGLSSYNAGMQGADLAECKMVVDAYLLRHPPPEIIVLTVDGPSFDLSKRFHSRAMYYPFTDNPVVYHTLADAGFETEYFKIFPFLELMQIDDYSRNNAFKGLMGKTEIPRGEFDYRGYLSNTANCIDTTRDSEYQTHKLNLDKEAVDLFQSIADTCKANGIKLIVTYAPEYDYRLQKTFANFNEFRDLVVSVCAGNGIPLYWDDNLEMCMTRCLFRNYGHVNTTGASVYSAILGKRLQELKPL